MQWDWKAEGFESPPQKTQAGPRLLLYRAWGGSSSKCGSPTRPGVCLSTQRPASRVEAERLFSAWEWGNSCLWLTTFRVEPGTTLYVGDVDAGVVLDTELLAAGKGVQVFIENPVAARLFELGTARLADDMAGRWVGSPSKAVH